MSDESGGDGEELELSGLRDSFVFSGTVIDYDYTVGVLTLAEPPASVACISVCAVDQSVLVALPDSAWHRLRRNRFLPPDTLKKAVRVTVKACDPGDRTLAGDSVVNVWLGLLSPVLEEQVVFGGDEDAEMAFGVDENGVTLEPYAEALVAVSRDHFTFFSAESADQAPAAAGMEERMDKVEAGLDKLVDMVSRLQRPTEPAAKAAAASGAKAPGRDGGVVSKAAPAHPPSLEPALVQQALGSGLDPSVVAELGKLLQPPGLGRKPALRTPAARPPADEAEGSASSEEEEEDPAGASGSAAPLQKAVLSLAKIVKGMRKERKSAKSKSLEALLDGAEGGGTQRDIGTTSRSKAAALRALQQALVSQPELIYESIEKQLQADWERSGAAPGLSTSLVSARGWLEHRSKIQNYATSVRPAWLMAGVWDCLRHDKIGEARARAALAVAVMDQHGCDRGSWLLASEATLEIPPPFSAFSQHTPPEPWELQHSQLIDPRWVELFLAKLKDLAEYQEKKSKLGGKGKRAEEPAAKDGKSEATAGKGRGKNAKKGKKEGGESNPSAPASEN